MKAQEKPCLDARGAASGEATPAGTLILHFQPAGCDSVWVPGLWHLATVALVNYHKWNVTQQ